MQSRKLTFLPVKDLKGILYTDCNISESDPASPDCGGGWLVSYLHTREGDRTEATIYGSGDRNPWRGRSRRGKNHARIAGYKKNFFG